MAKKKEEKGKKNDVEYVTVNIDDVIEVEKRNIMETHGGINWDDIKYVGTVEKLTFSIPKLERKGKCNETEYFCEDDPDKGGCGETGGACICGLKEGHDGDHECEQCGEEW